MSTLLLEHFNKFWINYPKKRKKGSAKKVWLRIKPGEELLKKMLAKIMESKRSKDWQKDNGQFIPYPATWLNGECWDDEFDKPINHPFPLKPNVTEPRPAKHMCNPDGSPMSMRQIIEAGGNAKALKIYDDMQDKKKRQAKAKKLLERK